MKEDTKELIKKRAEIAQRELKPEDFTHIELRYINSLLKSAFFLGLSLSGLIVPLIFVIINK